MADNDSSRQPNELSDWRDAAIKRLNVLLDSEECYTYFWKERCKSKDKAFDEMTDRFVEKLDALERELSSKDEEVDSLSQQLAEAKGALRLAAGELSTYGDYTSKPPYEVYDNLIAAARIDDAREE